MNIWGSFYMLKSKFAVFVQQYLCKQPFSANSLEQHIDGLVQERRNSSALVMGLHLSSTNRRYQVEH